MDIEYLVHRTPDVSTYHFADDGTIPNNPVLPLLVYAGALRLPADDPAAGAEAVFAANHWGRRWRDGVYPYHHFHSTAHEALAVCAGEARLQLGGERGVSLAVTPGDVLVLPAGCGHKKLESSEDFLVVGAYPHGQDWDLCYGRSGERPRVLDNIARVALPMTDPVYGSAGPIFIYWHPAQP